MGRKTRNILEREARPARDPFRFRRISVADKTRVAERFWRIRFSGTDLSDFDSPAFDNLVTLFFPDPKTGAPHLPEVTPAEVVWKDDARFYSREFTPLAFEGSGVMTLDVFSREGELDSDWAARALPGQELVAGAPGESSVLSDEGRFQLYVCDESALPAFRRRQSAVKAGDWHLFAGIDETAGRAYLGGLEDIDARWLGSAMLDADNLGMLIGALDKVSLPADDYLVWLAGEGETVALLSDYFTQRRGCDPACVHAVAYRRHRPLTAEPPLRRR
ncbi:SIP domain-containing protein [Acerihabitans sp. KWT182]|uniref:SIP domain-containing protein n=1 Tax=Acerihabitans sp. KWT182 TaxID=3157919 RepID=A0AAU7Q5M5_9GAMM